MSKSKDITQEQFLDEVIEKSKTIPVLVDFWAPWCEPCKQLTPLLEDLVSKKNGKILLVKINIDENKDLATKLNIQSIPTVYAFVDGKPINAFQGAQPESQIEKLLNEMIDAAPGNEIPKLIEEADKKFMEKNYIESSSLYENLLGMDAGNHKIIIGLLRSYYQLGLIEKALEIYESLDDKMISDENIIKIKKLLDSSMINEGDHEKIEVLKTTIANNSNDKQSRFDLACLLLKNKEIGAGFEQLLFLFELDSNWKEQAAKFKLLEYFEMLGFNDPNVITARKKLSSVMFK